MQNGRSDHYEEMEFSPAQPHAAAASGGSRLTRLERLLIFAILGLILGFTVSNMIVIVTGGERGREGPVGLTGNTGPEGPEGPPGPSPFANATNGLTAIIEEGAVTVYLGGTLIQDTDIVQDQNELHFYYGQYIETSSGRISLSPNIKGGVFIAKWSGEVALTGSMLLDDGSKRDIQNMLDRALETPLTFYQQFAGLSDRKREMHKRAIVGVQSVAVHGDVSLTDLSLVLAQSFGAAILNLDPSNNNAQIVVNDFGISLNTQQTPVEFNLGNGDLFIRNLNADTGHDQILVRDSGSQKVMWSTLSGAINAVNGLHLDGTDVKLGGSLIEDTYIDQDSYVYTHTFNAHDTLIISASVTMSPDNGELYMPGLDADPNNSDQNLVRYSGNGQVSWVERKPTPVYTDNVDPNAASIFSFDYPPTVDDPSAHSDPRYYYMSSDGTVWYYDTGSGTYLMFGGSFVATPEMSGSSCIMYTSGKMSIDNTDPHVYDSSLFMRGASVFCASDRIILRNGGIYEIVAEEHLDEGTLGDVAEYAIYVDGTLVAGSSGYMNNDAANGLTSKSARAIVKADGERIVTIKTVTYVNTPIIGPNSSVTAKQLCSF